MRISRVLLSTSLLFAALVVPARAADVTGDWRVTISSPAGPITGEASLKQTGDRVTGWVGPSKDDPIPIEGALKKNTLTIKTLPQPGRSVAFDRCTLTVRGDKMTGTTERQGAADKGTIELVRAKP